MNNVTDIYREASAGNEEAFKFLMGWNATCHGIDDIVDGDIKDAEDVIKIFAYHATVFSSPFWIQYRDTLLLVVLGVYNNYADSLTLSKDSPELPSGIKPWSNWLRFVGNDLVVAVAQICGGYELGRKISLKLRVDSFNTHHTETGEPK